jgi:hypothetical protein
VDNTKPVVNFNIPAVSHLYLVYGILSATDLNGIAGYCKTAVNDSSGCDWTATFDPYIIFIGEGNNTVYAWAKDPAGNVSALTNTSSATTLVALPHTLNIDLAGTGEGTITYGGSASNIDFTATVYSFDQVTLVPTRYPYSLFSGWSGVCSGTVECNYTVPTVFPGGSTHTATATFTFDWPNAVKVLPNNTFYQKISEAYAAASTASSATIRAWGTAFDDTLLFNLIKQVTLLGGDNEAHNDNSAGVTTVPGPLTIQSGAITMDRIMIK